MGIISHRIFGVGVGVGWGLTGIYERYITPVNLPIAPTAPVMHLPPTKAPPGW